MSAFLGIDGGGTKTDFLLIDDTGRVLSAHRAGSAYHLETGIDALESMLTAGIRTTLRRAALAPDEVSFAFIGLPAHGEDSALSSRLDGIAAVLPPARHRCGNDMVCGWAGALAGCDGINLVAGTGSIAYGEFAGRRARAGGWGELFSDEGSAYWVAREGMTLFSRMSDGRATQGPLYALVRERFGLRNDLDLCAAVYGPAAPLSRSEFAGLASLVARAAAAGDPQAQGVFEAAGRELAGLVDAVRDALRPPPQAILAVSYCGGMFQFGELMLVPLRAALRGGTRNYVFSAPRLTPVAGAALYAARLNETPLAAAAVAALARHCAAVNASGGDEFPGGAGGAAGGAAGAGAESLDGPPGASG